MSEDFEIIEDVHFIEEVIPEEEICIEPIIQDASFQSEVKHDEPLVAEEKHEETEEIVQDATPYTELKIAVIGAGAVGCVVAATLTQCGYNVELACGFKDLTEKIQAEGIKLRGKEVLTVKVNAKEKAAHLSGVKDIIVIATKAFSAADAARSALPLANENTIFVSMQNGICVDEIGAVVGRERTVGCVIGFGVTQNAPADITKTADGNLIIGAVSKNNQTVEDFALALSCVAPTYVTDSIYSELYSKLIINCCVTSLGAICGLKLEQMIKNKKVRNIFLGISSEILNVASALDIYVPPYDGKIDYYAMTAKVNGLSTRKSDAIIKSVGKAYGNVQSSILKSWERDEKTEIDYFNGYISHKGEELNIPTPINTAVVEIIKKIEKKELTITPKNLDNPLFLVTK